MEMWQRVAFIVLALLMAAPPTKWPFVALAIGFLGLAFLVPNRKDDEENN